MCIPTKTIKFCTCSKKSSTNDSLNYWILYRYDEKCSHYVGEVSTDYTFDFDDQIKNIETLEKRLNEEDSFDKKHNFNKLDKIDVVLTRVLQNPQKNRKVKYTFIYSMKEGWKYVREPLFILYPKENEIIGKIC